jgi:hypothetical protein
MRSRLSSRGLDCKLTRHLHTPSSNIYCVYIVICNWQLCTQCGLSSLAPCMQAARDFIPIVANGHVLTESLWYMNVPVGEGASTLPLVREIDAKNVLFTSSASIEMEKCVRFKFIPLRQLDCDSSYLRSVYFSFQLWDNAEI